MNEQGAPLAAAASPEQDTNATPLATSTEHTPLAAEPKLPPPASLPGDDSIQDQDDPMQLDEDSIAVAHPQKDTPEDSPLVSQPEPEQLPMATSQTANVSTPTREASASARGSRSNKRVSFPIVGAGTPSAMTDATPSSTSRGRPPGRPRGSRARGPTRGTTRGNRGGRGGKRKRADDDDSDGASSDSETYAPTTTKSGRSVQKPTTFVPPPQPSPPPMPSYKKKRTYRRNPESAVCKICLRGVSPASNMIVFCDGCNVPYHRYCHQPPIDQSVIDEVDKEWYCKQCERERIQPVPESHVVGFVSAENASAEEVCAVTLLMWTTIEMLTRTVQQRQKYFSSLSPGLLVTLLTKASTLHPDLPLFDPSFQPTGVTTAILQPAANGHAHPSAPHIPAAPATIFRNAEDSDDDQYGSDEHPSHYPRPGQGLMSTLPPEKNDLHYLVDEENSRGVFTHVYQVDEQTEGAAGVSGGTDG
jgi:hypothetical protein